MSSILPIIVTMIVVICFQMAQPQWPKRFSEKGLLRPGKATGSTPANPAWWLTAAIFALMAINTFVTAFIQGQKHGFTANPQWWFALLGIVGITLLGAALCLIRALQVWTWDASGIEWRGVFRKTKVSWTQAARVGRTWDGGWFVGPEKGPSVTWSRISAQSHDAVLNAVKYARPDLLPPPAPPKAAGPKASK